MLCNMNEDHPIDRAAIAEFDSWIDLLMVKRDLRCPNGWPHDYMVEPPESNYCFICTNCDHHSPFPF
jgi:hypothetical protein